jgi:fumarate hydratase class II
MFEALSSQDTAVEMSGQLRVLAVSLTKIANDLRWMNSGPLAGIGEIELPALQPGSSIMPGKVNPVIPEAVAMVCAQVVGNDATIAMGGQCLQPPAEHRVAGQCVDLPGRQGNQGFYGQRGKHQSCSRA